MAWQIGVDVGGTFTDLLALDPERGVFRVAKVPSTPEDQSVGFIAGLAVLETDLAAVAALVHGTTVATNAVLERKGARCGLITTAGFRDVLELGRRTRPNPYGMTGSFESLIPRDLRAEVPERIDAAGRVLTPLDEAAVRQEVHRLRERGAEALVIHFIHAYANPAHEQRCGEIAREIWPNRFVTLGSDILREVREFERGSTAALNGYVQPIVSRYLGRLSQNPAQCRAVQRSSRNAGEWRHDGGGHGHRSRRAHRHVRSGRRSDRCGADRRAGRPLRGTAAI